jgi:hypothetical protein
VKILFRANQPQYAYYNLPLHTDTKHLRFYSTLGTIETYYNSSHHTVMTYHGTAPAPIILVAPQPANLASSRTANTRPPSHGGHRLTHVKPISHELPSFLDQEAMDSAGVGLSRSYWPCWDRREGLLTSKAWWRSQQEQCSVEDIGTGRYTQGHLHFIAKINTAVRSSTSRRSRSKPRVLIRIWYSNHMK